MSEIPFFVLVRPQMGENIGASARAMYNFGLDQMRLVAPRDGWPNPAAAAMAKGARRLLDEAQVSDDLTGALQDCTFVFATTARSRGMTKPVFSPEAAMKLAVDKIDAGDRVAVLFGPERAGLENDDVTQANALISVPVNPDYGSLNLAQCVLLIGYEWMRQRREIAHETVEMPGTRWATVQEVAQLTHHFEELLEEANFFELEHKTRSMKANIRNLWSRMPLTHADVQLFHGMLRKLVRGRECDD